MELPSVIGEGAYGCIHKPSLKCKDSKIQNYKNKVSKVLQKSKAKQELEEYGAIKQADQSNEYYLGIPVECDVDNVPTNIQAIEKCDNGKGLLKNLDDLSLLIMEDGGLNSKDYATLMGKWPATPEYVEKTERFLIEFHRIFHGINVFLENGILHFDMKPQNIVYSDKSTQMRIIDFGLTVSLKDKITQTNNSTNSMARFHWSYPFEFYYLNKNTYDQVATMSKPEKDELFQSILQKIATKTSDISIPIKTFFSFVYDQTTESARFTEHMANFYQTLFEITKQNYENFVKKSLSSVDVYGLGISLLYVLKNIKHLIKEKIYTDLYELGNNMINAQLSKRITSNAALAQYETILTENGIMANHRVSFTNHKIVQGEILPTYIEKSIQSVKLDDVLLNNTALEKNAISVDIAHKEPLATKAKPKKAKKTAKKRPGRPKKTNKKQSLLQVFSR